MNKLDFRTKNHDIHPYFDMNGEIRATKFGLHLFNEFGYYSVFDLNILNIRYETYKK